ncbi:MAG: glycerol-3-phosphate acyltransferase, partial [Chloroflexi bacterium]|nr:glycerol-3-phosphate acyltransferase [Chloroflexota bacterium]
DLTGAIPTAYLVARYWRGVDIRTTGSGNVGAVNTFKAAGLRPGIAVLLLDTAKGAAVMALILALDLEPEGAFAAALAVTLGHNFSIFLRLKGGKGVAVVFGLSFVIFPVLTALALITLPIAWRLSRSIVWSFLAAFVVLNTLVVATGQDANDVGLCFTLSIVVVATHLWRNRIEVIEALRHMDFVGIGKIE